MCKLTGIFKIQVLLTFDHYSSFSNFLIGGHSKSKPLMTQCSVFKFDEKKYEILRDSVISYNYIMEILFNAFFFILNKLLFFIDIQVLFFSLNLSDKHLLSEVFNAHNMNILYTENFKHHNVMLITSVKLHQNSLTLQTTIQHITNHYKSTVKYFLQTYYSTEIESLLPDSFSLYVMKSFA